MQAALQRALLIAPILTIEEMAQSEQLAARGYWRELHHPELGRAVRYPGPFGHFSKSPITYRHRPPTVGEHNQEIYVNELGMTEQQLAELRHKGVI
jgi:crotonobetainyl-CoA:carnitine CoA-transferase CaiB-like acyl-CoA transferase